MKTQKTEAIFKAAILNKFIQQEAPVLRWLPKGKMGRAF